jgi:hypothetical protein
MDDVEHCLRQNLIENQMVSAKIGVLCTQFPEVDVVFSAEKLLNVGDRT